MNKRSQEESLSIIATSMDTISGSLARIANELQTIREILENKDEVGGE